MPTCERLEVSQALVKCATKSSEFMKTRPMLEQESADDEALCDADKTRSEDFISVYANIVEMHRTPFDLRLTFGEIESISPRLWIEDRVAVTLSWQEAKRLALYLALQVLGHEQRTKEAIQIPSRTCPNFIRDELANLPINKMLAAIFTGLPDSKLAPKEPVSPPSRRTRRSSSPGNPREGARRFKSRRT
jgi:hypothetical protein